MTKDNRTEGPIYIDPNKKGKQIVIVYESTNQNNELIERKKDAIYMNEDQHLLGFRNIVNNKQEYIQKSKIIRMEVKE